MVVIQALKQCQKEIEEFPEEIGEDLADLLVLVGQGDICLVHAFKKKTQQTP